MPVVTKCHNDREARLRRKLVNNEMNPFADAILSSILLALTPFICWEDPRMDQRVFKLDESDHIITIASAGCNVLDYIIHGATVTAVDFNSCQIALTELKKVAIIQLDYESFFEIFSKSNMKLLQEVYPKLRASLSQPSAEFWDKNVYTIKSFMYSGTSGNMVYVLFRILFPLLGLGFIRNELIKGTSPEEMKKQITKRSYPLRYLAWFMDNVLLRFGCCFAGVPERQMALGFHRPNNLAIVTERVLFNTDLVNDNYFYAGYFLGYYTQQNCPRYLKKENFAALKKYLTAGKLHLVHGTLLSAIDSVTSPITVASLLDHMDWMTDRQINEEITHLINKMDPVRGKIFWRTFADDVHSATLQWMNPERVDDSDDRVGMYWTTWIAQLKNFEIAYEERVDTKQSKGFVSDFLTGLKVVTFPFWKPLIASTLKVSGHAKDMESFYKYQKDDYDAFREGLLHARPALMEAFPLSRGGNMVWVDIGGGTARNLEFFTVEVIRKYFKAIYIVDISASLLEIAQKRVNAMGIQDIVKVIEHDVTAESVFTVLPTPGSVDIITMSYSYSMIPDKKAAIANATKLLKQNGYLAIADFFLKGNYDDILPRFARALRAAESLFHKNWFAFDHVYLLGDKELEFGNTDELTTVWDNRFRGDVPFLFFLKPYHGVFIAKKN
eukprot:gene19355-25221_t